MPVKDNGTILNDDGPTVSPESPGDGIPDAQDFDPLGCFSCKDNGQLISGCCKQ